MPLTGLAPLDSSWQPARFFVINDRRLQANRVDHRSFAGFSLHNLGSGQQVAAGARRRGRRSAHRSAVKFSCSGGATMCRPSRQKPSILRAACFDSAVYMHWVTAKTYGRHTWARSLLDRCGMNQCACWSKVVGGAIERGVAVNTVNRRQ